MTTIPPSCSFCRRTREDDPALVLAEHGEAAICGACAAEAARRVRAALGRVAGEAEYASWGVAK